MVKKGIQGLLHNGLYLIHKGMGKQLTADLSNAEASDVRVNLTSTGFDFDGSAFNESK